MADTQFVRVIFTVDFNGDVSHDEVHGDKKKAKERYAVLREKLGEKYKDLDHDDTYGQVRRTHWYGPNSPFILMMIVKPVRS